MPRAISFAGITASQWSASPKKASFPPASPCPPTHGPSLHLRCQSAKGPVAENPIEPISDEFHVKHHCAWRNTHNRVCGAVK